MLLALHLKIQGLNKDQTERVGRLVSFKENLCICNDILMNISRKGNIILTLHFFYILTTILDLLKVITFTMTEMLYRSKIKQDCHYNVY